VLMLGSGSGLELGLFTGETSATVGGDVWG